MRFVISAIDSAGGFSNLVHVAAELQKRGHRITLILPTDMIPMAKWAGVDDESIVELPFDLSRALEDSPDVLESSNSFSLFVRGAKFVHDLFGVNLGLKLPDILKEDPNTIVIGNSLFLAGVYPLLVRYGVTKTVMLDSIVAGSPLIEADSMLLEASLPGKRRLMAFTVHLLMAMPARIGIQASHHYGGSFRPTFWTIQKKVSLAIFALDPMIYADVARSDNVIIPGTPIPEQPASVEGHQNLERIQGFLAGKQQCIFVTWGSRNPSKMAKDRLQLLMRAASKIGVSLIIQTNLNPDAFGEDRPGDILFVDGYVSHLAAFRLIRDHTQAAAYLGATGPGATHIAMISGLPIITLKSGYADQWFWADYFGNKGCVVVLPRFDDESAIITAINQVLSGTMQGNAQSISGLMATHGLDQAVEAILDLI